MPTISPAKWAATRAIIDNFTNDPINGTGLSELIWQRSIVSPIPKLGNDEDIKFEENITLKCLFEYNVKRVWPLTKYTDSGEEDKQSVVAMLNVTYLESLNLLDENRNFAYSPAHDKFIHKGIEYYSAGDTPVSQVQADAIWYYLVLRRSDFAT